MVGSEGAGENTGGLPGGGDAISAVTAEAMNSAGSDLTALRADLNGLKDTVTKFISQVRSEAAKSASEVTSSVADQGAEMMSAASEQAKTVASELESMARRHPLGAIAGAVLIRCTHWPVGATKLMLFRFLKCMSRDSIRQTVPG
jgi:predicted phage tail protein